jgi:hypothetical protein
MALDTLLGWDTATNEQVILPFATRTQGTYVLGKNGMGKTNLILNMIETDFQEADHANGEPVSLFAIDPSGDMALDIARMCPEGHVDKLTLVEFKPGSCPGINLFRVDDPAHRRRAADQLVQVFRKIWDDSWGQAMQDLLNSLTRVFVDNPGVTMREIPRFLRDEDFRNPLVRRSTNAIAKEFWLEEFNRLTEPSQRLLVAPLLRRVREWLLDPILLEVFSSPETTIDFRGAMDRGEWVVFRIPMGELGEGVTSFLGAVILDQISQAAFSRQDTPREQRTRCHVYCDEYHRFSTPATAELFTGVRQFNVGMTVAHQVREQIDAINKASASNAATQIFFQLTAKDARELAGELTQLGGQPKTVPPKLFSYILRHQHPHSRVRELTPIIERKMRPVRGGNDMVDEYLAMWFDEGRYRWPPSKGLPAKEICALIFAFFDYDDMRHLTTREIIENHINDQLRRSELPAQPSWFYSEVFQNCQDTMQRRMEEAFNAAPRDIAVIARGIIRALAENKDTDKALKYNLLFYYWESDRFAEYTGQLIVHSREKGRTVHFGDSERDSPARFLTRPGQPELSADVHELAQYLLKVPPLVSQVDPYNRLPEQSTAETLANLPRWHFHIKLGAGEAVSEHTAKGAPRPQMVESSWHLPRIRDESRERYRQKPRDDDGGETLMEAPPDRPSGLGPNVRRRVEFKPRWHPGDEPVV